LDLTNSLPVIDGIRAECEQKPTSLPELAEVMHKAWESGTSVIPIGGGTKIGLGNPPRSAGVALRTAALRGIVEHEPDNLTISVLAGTPLQDVQDCVRSHSQFLPLDPPNPNQATLGGIVACNTSGPIRFRYGTVRDLLLGVKVVLSDGTPTRAGGKLVKNVSGYDMCKLYTGSLGTLGLLGELTFKLEPRPECLGTALFGFDTADRAFSAARRVLNSRTVPDALEIWNSRGYEVIADNPAGNRWILAVRFGGIEAAVKWQLDRAKESLAGTETELVREVPVSESEALWNRAASARESTLGEDPLLLKCSVLLGHAHTTARKLEHLAAQWGAQGSLFCHAGNGVLYAALQWPGEIPALTRFHAGLLDLRAHCHSCSGHMVVEKMGHALKTGFDVWGYQAPAVELMRRIKQEFDPKGLLNPGRFVGGI
jgi:glycolate oxidase FAD binding subunit